MKIRAEFHTAVVVMGIGLSFAQAAAGPQMLERALPAVVTVAMNRLPDPRLSSIGSFVLKNDVSVQTAVRGRVVVVERTTASGEGFGLPALQFVQLRQNQEAVPIARPLTDLVLVGVGVIGQNDALLYRAENMDSVGAALKLVSMTGRIDLLCVPNGATDPVAAKFQFPAGPAAVGRTLLY